jgi:peroxidase
MATPNNGSVRGFEVIDAVKSAVEKVCPGVVSCADILAVAARDSVVILGGPSWDVKVGRRDSTTASFSGANNNIPPPTSGLANLTSLFAAQGLSKKDMVALSGTSLHCYFNYLPTSSNKISKTVNPVVITFFHASSLNNKLVLTTT